MQHTLGWRSGKRIARHRTELSVTGVARLRRFGPAGVVHVASCGRAGDVHDRPAGIYVAVATLALGEGIPLTQQIARMPGCRDEHRMWIGGMACEARFPAAPAGKVTAVAACTLHGLPIHCLQEFSV
jgi:hypothetical protein